MLLTFKRGFCVFIVAVLTGCGGNSTLVATSVTNPPEPVTVTEAQDMETESPIVTMPPPPPEPRYIVENIVGLDPAVIKTIMGDPVLERTEKTIQVWLYKNEDCLLHLYFYENDNGDSKLDYVDTVKSNIEPSLSADKCLDSHLIVDNIKLTN